MPLVRVPTLTDGVVTLRGHRDEDVEAIVEQSRDPLSLRWTNLPDPYGREDARRFVRDVMAGGWAEDQEWGFAVEAPERGRSRYAGTVSLRREGEGRAEIAYGSHPWARGRGVMERALRLLLDWGFSPARDGGLDLATVIWWAEVGNWASRRVAWHVGFSCDGTVRRWLRNRDGRRVDAWVGTLTREDPREPRSTWLEVPRIEGFGVRLRIHRADDLDRMHEGATDPVTAYWLGRIPDPYSREEAADFLVHRSDGMAAGTDLHWMLADPDTDTLLGTVSLMHIHEGMAEVGYWAHPDARGRGVMTEAVRLACRHAVITVDDGGLGLHRVYATVAVDNSASRRVLEKNGFRLHGTERRSVLVRDRMHDGAAYELLAEEFTAR